MHLVAITCGPERAAKMLTDRYAVGVDSMLHVVADTTEMDSMQIQSILVALSNHCEADVVLCGKQAADTNSGSTGPGIASLMGNFPCVGMVSEVSVDGDGFSALRASSMGNERVSVSRPCLFASTKVYSSSEGLM